MYTLIFIGYIILSLPFVWHSSLDKRGLYGAVIEKGAGRKEAFITGFSVIPFVAIVLTIVYWGLKLILVLLILLFDAGEWIYYNMP